MENNLILKTWELKEKLLEYVVYEIHVQEGMVVLRKECLGVLGKDEKKGWKHERTVSRWVGASELGREKGRRQHRRGACASIPRHCARPVKIVRDGDFPKETRRTLSSSIANVFFNKILSSSSFSSTSKETIWLTKDGGRRLSSDSDSLSSSLNWRATAAS